MNHSKSIPINKFFRKIFYFWAVFAILMPKKSIFWVFWCKNFEIFFTHFKRIVLRSFWAIIRFSRSNNHSMRSNAHQFPPKKAKNRGFLGFSRSKKSKNLFFTYSSLKGLYCRHFEPSYTSLGPLWTSCARLRIFSSPPAQQPRSLIESGGPD